MVWTPVPSTFLGTALHQPPLAFPTHTASSSHWILPIRCSRGLSIFHSEQNPHWAPSCLSHCHHFQANISNESPIGRLHSHPSRPLLSPSHSETAVPIKLYFGTLTFEFYIIFALPQNITLLLIFPTIKNDKKPFLSHEINKTRWWARRGPPAMVCGCF